MYVGDMLIIEELKDIYAQALFKSCFGWYTIYFSEFFFSDMGPVFKF